MNKKLLCTAVGASLVATTGLAQANFEPQYLYAFVPYVVKDANRTTVVSVILDDDSDSGASKIMHLQYWTKSTTDANTAACSPSSVSVPVTPNDIVTWDTAGLLGYPLFGDTTNPAPLGMAISYAAPRHGYLVVEAPSDAEDGSTEGGEGNEIVNSYWLELDLANGGAHGDMAQGLYTVNLQDLNGESLDDDWTLDVSPADDLYQATAVQFWPSSIATQHFTVTPLGTDMLTRENNQAILQVFNANQNQGAYDRNENGVDGTVPITVRCVGRVTPAQLMPGVVTNAAWAAQGGWGYLANIGDGDADLGGSDGEAQGGTNSGDLEVMIYQVDTSTVGGRFMTNATLIRTDHGHDPIF